MRLWRIKPKAFGMGISKEGRLRPDFFWNLEFNEESSTYLSLFLDFTSVKISNNALNFLLAQYRAIFKRAYVKSIASAVMLTAGLAAGQAQAANELADVNNLPASGETVYIDGTAAATEGHYNLINIVSGTSNSFNGALVIKKGSADGVSLGDNFIIGGTSAAKITGLGRLTIAVEGSNATDGLLIGGNGNEATVNIGAIDVQNGLLNVTDKAGGSGSVTVAADTINIGGSSTSSKAYLTLTSSGSNTSATLGRVAGTQDGLSASQITVGESGVLIMKGSSTSGASILGASLKIAAGGVMLTDNGNANKVLVDDFTVENGAFKVISGAAAVSETFEGKTGTVQGNVLVGTSGTWVISDTALKDDGEQEIQTTVTFESGSNVQLSGTLSISGGKVVVKDGAGLHAITAATSANDNGSIKLSKNSTTNAIGTLAISTAALEQYLEGTGKHKTISDSDSDGTYELGKTESPDAKGAILLSGGTLELTGTSANKPYDLATELAFSGSLSNAAPGMVGIANSSSGTIAGEHLAITKQLSDLAKTSATSLVADKGLFIKASESLTLGSTDFDSSTEDDLGFSGATTKDLILVDKNGTFFLQGNDINLRAVTLDGNNVEVGTNGVIKGNLNVSGATLTVEAGNYTADDDLTISSGSLTITGDSPATASTDSDGGRYYPGINSVLKVNGNFELTNGTNNTNSSISISGGSGATAALDLREADSVTWGSGTVTISGAVARNSATDVNSEAGEGILYIKGEHFSDFLDTTATTNPSATLMEVKDGGVLYVEGSTTGTKITVDDFKSGAASTAGVVAFNGAGTAEFTTATTISIDSGSAGTVLAIGKGTIKAPSLTLNNNKTGVNNFTVSGGTIEVSNSLSSNHNVVFTKENTNVAKLVLNREDAGNGQVNANLTFSDSSSTLEVEQGTWQFAEGKDALFNSGADFTIGAANQAASLTVDNINFAGTDASSNAAVSTINDGSSLTVTTLQAGSGATFNVSGTMTILGKTFTKDSGGNVTYEEGEIQQVKDANATAGINLAGSTFTVTGAESQLKLGATATSSLISFVERSVPNGGTTTTVKDLTVNDALNNATISLNQFGELYLDFSSGTSITSDNAAQLKSALFSGDGTGIINVGSGALDIVWTDKSELTTTWDKVKEFAEIESVTSDELKSALITGVDEAVAGHYGAMELSTPGATLSVDGSFSLNAARDGFFAYTKNADGTKTAANIDVTATAPGSSMLLAGKGQIGSIDGNNVTDLYIAPADESLAYAQAGTTEILGDVSGIAKFDVSNETTVAGDVTANSLDLAANTSLSNVVSGTATTMELGSAYTAAGSSLNTTNLTLTGADGSWIMGSIAVADTLTAEATATTAGSNEIIIANGSVSADSTVLEQGVNLIVGLDANAVDDDKDTTDIDESLSYTGSFETQSLELNGATLIVDPTFEQQTAIASVYHFADVTASDVVDDKLVGTMDGSVFVGQNSALGVGTENLDALRAVVSKYQVDGSLAGDYGSILYLAGTTEIAANQGVVMTAQSITDFLDHVQTDGTIGAGLTQEDPTLDNTVFFGEGSALIATAEAIDAAQTNGTSLITFENEGTLVADGGEVLVSGDLRVNSTGYNLFGDATADGNAKVEVVDIKNQAVADGKGIKVKTDNGFLVGEINNTNGGQGVTLSLAKNARGIMSGASDPVFDTLKAYVLGYNGTEDTDLSDGDQTDRLYDGYELDANGLPTTNKNYSYSNEFLAASIEQGNGAAAEAAARMGVYGGAPQAAIKAGQSSTDAIAARFGIGSAISNLTVAGNTQGAALWLAPVYKTSDSDGFDAQGVDYGVNVDLYGVALGADYTLANGISFGAMFNVGSGEVDGEGAASPVTNDFDYYGFGAYAGYTMGQFSVVGDISYTVADNEVEASTSVDHIGAQMDSTNLSVGVTGKYDLSFNGVNVTPHVGLRYSNIDLDDYTIDGEEVVGSADSDKLNLFSIPVGVTIAKEFKGESWTVAPSFDLTLTGQFGDDELDGSVSWAGVSNLTTDTTTEVFDNFTYGATLGVEAQSVGGVALGINVGYTGSSNVDEFGVNANARFTF